MIPLAGAYTGLKGLRMAGFAALIWSPDPGRTADERFCARHGAVKRNVTPRTFLRNDGLRHSVEFFRGLSQLGYDVLVRG
jgi:hypothetical protein